MTKEEKELIIHFDNIEICLINLKELGININKEDFDFIKKIHENVCLITSNVPKKISSEICYRMANKIIKIIEFKYDVKIKKYKLHNFS